MKLRTYELFDDIKAMHGIKNDAALARRLDVGQAQISKIRNGVNPCPADIVLRVHEVLGVPVATARALLAKTAARGQSEGA